MSKIDHTSDNLMDGVRRVTEIPMESKKFASTRCEERFEESLVF
jgi:hypothetical protein